MLDKVKKWISNNKGFTIILLLALILIVILAVIFISLISGGSSSEYGNRLDGIEEVKIDDDVYQGVKDEVMATELAEDVSTRLQGKIVQTTIVLKGDTSVDKAKEIASNTIDNYSEEQLKYYDFSYFLKWNNDDGMTVITGNRHRNFETITWVKSQVKIDEKKK